MRHGTNEFVNKTSVVVENMINYDLPILYGMETIL